MSLTRSVWSTCSGVATGAASGALAARRQDSFDLVGVLGLAFATGLGGGLLRDLLLNVRTPVALTDALYLPTVHRRRDHRLGDRGRPGPRVLRAINVLDALAVGFFAVAGALPAKQAGVTVPAQLLIGVLGGSGGALLRDVLTARTPEIFRHGELNALAALAAAGVFLPADTPTCPARPRWPSGCSSASPCGAPRCAGTSEAPPRGPHAADDP